MQILYERTGALGMAEWALQRMMRITTNKKGIITFVIQ